MSKGKDITIKLISFSAALLLVLCGYIVCGFNAAARTGVILQNGYNSSLTELCDYLENITLNLHKQLYVQSPEQTATLANKLSADSACAKSALERLPISSEYTSGIYRFLSQAGDYSAYLARASANGVSDKDKEQLAALYRYSEKLSAAVDDVQALAAEGDYWSTELKSTLKSVGGEQSALNISAKDISQTNTDYPKLIYDGPFSDHMMSGSAKYIENKAKISLNDAKQRAAKFLGCDNADVTYRTTDDGNIRSYTFVCGTNGTNGTKQIGITEQGGALIYISDSREVTSRKISEDDAVKLAKKYLADKYALDFAESYYTIDNNICVINFAYLQDGVICYPDLIKVGVALDNGEITGVEAGGFISNHQSRTPSFKYSKDDAEDELGDNLTVQKAKKCVINLGTDKEYCCYEFLCKGEDDEQLLVYIDANDLVTRNILILEITDGGTLTK